MILSLAFLLTSLTSAVAQAPPPEAPPPAAMQEPPLDNGPCLDSLRGVPKVVAVPVSRAMQIVRIDQVVSTATMTPGEIIGFLYTTEDGSTWLGQRTASYQSAADATEINRVLLATKLPSYNVKGFPPRTEYGVPTKHQEIFRVQMPTSAYAPLRIALVPCVAWPPARPLPDPSM
jgi:hypothetical protein